MSRIESPRLPETFFKNLRSGLDHLAYALFMVGPRGTSGSPAKHVYFPISDDSTKYVAESRGKVKGMRRDAIDAINAVKPYKGGNDTLWVLHKLNNVDKPLRDHCRFGVPQC
jgi:hypothetical protein